MKSLKLIAFGAAVGLILVAFRDFENDRWLAPELPTDLDLEEEGDEWDEEPVLGYDGMDQETLLDWLDDADLDEDALIEILEYERAHRAREPVLAAVGDLLGE